MAEKILFKTSLACASLCTLEVSDYSVNLSATCLYGEFASSINIDTGGEFQAPEARWIVARGKRSVTTGAGRQ
jgi:hypothetical protein